MVRKSIVMCKWTLGNEPPTLSSEFALTRLSEMVFDPDNRKPADTKDYQKDGKYRAVLKLHMRYKNQSKDDKRWAAGSGWLIRPDLLVTAGHCVYDWENNLGPATYIKAYVGYHGKRSVNTDSDVQMRKGTVAVSPTTWVNGRARVNDFALVQLEKPFTDVVPLKYATTPIKGDEKIGVVGYPADKLDDMGERGAKMYADFEQVSYDRSQMQRLLAYHVSTYAGQSGSPLLRSNDNMSIATHVAGSSQMNFASPIGDNVENPYHVIIDYFFNKSSKPVLCETKSGIDYYDVPHGGEADNYAFLKAWKASKEINKAIPGDVLTGGRLFCGPIGAPSSVLAGTMLGYAGRLSLSALDNHGRLPQDLPLHTGYAERALLADSALEFLLQGKGLPKKTMEALAATMRECYENLHPFMGAASELVKGIEHPAVRMALEHIRRVENKTLPDGTVSTDRKKLSPSSESTQDTDKQDDQTTAFRKRLLESTYELEGEEGFFDVLGSVINLATSVPQTIVKLAPVALNLLSNVIQQESAFEMPKSADKAELTDLAQRSLLAEAALTAFIATSPDTLANEGFFDFVKTTMQKIGGAVLANAPRVIDAAVPIVKSLLKESGSQPNASTPGDGLSTLDDVLPGDNDDLVTVDDIVRGDNDAFGSDKNSGIGGGTRAGTNCWPNASKMVRDEYLSKTKHLQKVADMVPEMVKVSAAPGKADSDGKRSFDDILFGDAGQDGIYWES